MLCRTRVQVIGLIVGVDHQRHRRGSAHGGALRCQSGFAHLGVAGDRRKGAQPGDVVTRPAIEETELEQICAQELPPRANRQVKDARGAAALHAMLHEPFAVGRDLGDLPVDAFVAEVVQVVPQSASPAPSTRR